MAKVDLFEAACYRLVLVMKVRFWGVRGSFPVPGKQTNRYGGNTSCVEIEVDGHDPIVIDAGTGLRHLGKELINGRFQNRVGTTHLLISHTHWDHIQGLPYFMPLHTEGHALEIYARQPGDTHLASVFAQQTDGPYFPVPLESLRAEVKFNELLEGQDFSIGEVSIRCTRLNHPWIAMAYRLDHDGQSVVYCSDTAPFRDILLEHEFVASPPKVDGSSLDHEQEIKLRMMREHLVELCRDADFLIYDTQFTPEEYAAKPHWGHSTPDDAIAVAREANVKTLCMYHHAPARSDDAQDVILATYRDLLKDDSLELCAAMEGDVYDLGESRKGRGS